MTHARHLKAVHDLHAEAVVLDGAVAATFKLVLAEDVDLPAGVVVEAVIGKTGLLTLTPIGVLHGQHREHK